MGSIGGFVIGYTSRSAGMNMRNGRCQQARAMWAALRPQVEPSIGVAVSQSTSTGACVSPASVFSLSATLAQLRSSQLAGAPP